jgi:GT2 family glycosyltransferase
VTDEPILGHPRVDSALVTWNRLKLLTERLAVPAAWIRRRDDLVVDLVSTDGSHDVLRAQFPGVAPVTPTRNCEYTARILRHRKAIHVPVAHVLYKSGELGPNLVDPGVRLHRDFRNKIAVVRPGEVIALGQAVDDLESRW